MTDVQEHAHTTFVSLIEELSMRLPDSTRLFDVFCPVFHSTIPYHSGRGVCKGFTRPPSSPKRAPSSTFTGRFSCRDAVSLLKRTNLLSCITDYGVNNPVFISGVLFVFSARPHRVLCLTLTRNTEKNLHGLNFNSLIA